MILLVLLVLVVGALVAPAVMAQSSTPTDLVGSLGAFDVPITNATGTIGNMGTGLLLIGLGMVAVGLGVRGLMWLRKS